MSFQNDGKTAQAAKSVKYRIITKVVDSALSIDTSEQKCVMIKGMLQSTRLKYHVKPIGIEQSLIKNSLFEHKCMQNIKELYKHAGKCDDQQQLKGILEAAIVFTPEGFSNKST